MIKKDSKLLELSTNGEKQVRNVNNDFHLGTVLTNKKECVKEAIEERIQKCKSIAYATQSLVSHQTPITPDKH